MTTTTILPRPSRLPASIRAFASAALFTIVALLMTAQAGAQSPAFSTSELRDLKFGASPSVAAPSPSELTASELRDLRIEARKLGTPTYTTANVFGVTRTEMADLRSEWVVRTDVNPSFPISGFSPDEIRDLRNLAHAQQLAGEPVAIANR